MTRKEEGRIAVEADIGCGDVASSRVEFLASELQRLSTAESSGPLQWGSVLAICDELLLRAERLDLAVSAAMSVERDASAAGNVATSLRAWLVCGHCAHALGNMAGALEIFLACVDGARQHHMLACEEEAFLAIGRSLLALGLFGDASAALERAASLCSFLPDRLLRRGMVLSEIAHGAHEQRLLSNGILAAMEAVRSLDGARGPVHHEQYCIALVRLAQLLLLNGQIDEATACLTDLDRAVPASRSVRVRLMRSAVRALLSAYCRDFSAADSEVRLLVRAARVLPSQIVRDTLEIAADVAEISGDLESSVRYLRELARARSTEQTASQLQLPRIAQELGWQGAWSEDKGALWEPRLILESIAVTSDVLARQDPRHPYRVGSLARLVGHRIGIGGSACVVLEQAARLHDIGNSAIAQTLLRRPGGLAVAEMELLKQHSVAGGELIEGIQWGGASTAGKIARHHHERWQADGGYPYGLRGEAIPLEARIVAVCDQWDTLTHSRPYGQPMSQTDAIAEIQSAAGSFLDPDLCRVLISVVQEHRTSSPTELDEILEAVCANSPVYRGVIRFRDGLDHVLSGAET